MLILPHHNLLAQKLVNSNGAFWLSRIHLVADQAGLRSVLWLRQEHDIQFDKRNLDNIRNWKRSDDGQVTFIVKQGHAISSRYRNHVKVLKHRKSGGFLFGQVQGVLNFCKILLIDDFLVLDADLNQS